jgi:hypothetical protein
MSPEKQQLLHSLNCLTLVARCQSSRELHPPQHRQHPLSQRLQRLQVQAAGTSPSLRSMLPAPPSQLSPLTHQSHQTPPHWQLYLLQEAVSLEREEGPACMRPLWSKTLPLPPSLVRHRWQARQQQLVQLLYMWRASTEAWSQCNSHAQAFNLYKQTVLCMWHEMLTSVCIELAGCIAGWDVSAVIVQSL